MGASDFYNECKAASPEEAFLLLKEDAYYMLGHSGYTGTIAEKDCFSIASKKILTKEAAYKLAESLINIEYDDKWGPAGCILPNEDHTIIQLY